MAHTGSNGSIMYVLDSSCNNTINILNLILTRWDFFVLCFKNTESLSYAWYNFAVFKKRLLMFFWNTEEVRKQSLISQTAFAKELGVSYLMFLGEKQAYKAIKLYDYSISSMVLVHWPQEWIIEYILRVN